MSSTSLYNFSIYENMEFFLAGLAGQLKGYDKIDKEIAESQLETYQSVIDVQKGLRKLYDTYIPNIHVLDIDVLTRLLVNNIRSQPGKYISFKRGLAPTDELSDAVKEEALNSLVIGLSDENSKAYIKLKNALRLAIFRYWRSIKAPDNPIEKLNNLSEQIFKLQTGPRLTDQQAVSMGRLFAQKREEVFGGKRNTIGVYDTDIGSSKNRFVFFGNGYANMRDGINKVISSAVKEQFLNIIKTDIIEDIQAGYVANFGHSMIVSTDGNNELGRFVNTPGFASSLYGLAKLGQTKSQLEEAAVYYRDKSGLITNKLTFSKNFQAKTQYLMMLGLTITYPEDWDINQTRGRDEEKIAKEQLVGTSKRKKISSAEQKSFINYLISLMKEQILTKNPENAAGSRTLKEFIKYAVVSALKGEPLVEEKKKVNKQKNIPIKRRSVVLNTAAKKQLKLAKPKVTMPTSPSIAAGVKSLPKAQSNLPSLLNRINGLIQQQVQQNMGTGNSRDVLNYRSGRFAESVKVERLSESRQGMLTAFYSYMKNPYATFSQGGRQQYPRSRDPKTLISKSIREIAQTMVTNQLRAVNV